MIDKDLLEAAAKALEELQKRVSELENAASDPLETPHGDLIDRDSLAAELMLDDSTEIIARTKIINEYITSALIHAPVVVASNHSKIAAKVAEGLKSEEAAERILKSQEYRGH